MIPGKWFNGMGGAMDMCSGKQRIVVCMTHQTKDGKPKVVHENSYPLTAKKVIDLLITDKAVFSFRNNKMILEECLGDATVEEIRGITDAHFEIADIL